MVKNSLRFWRDTVCFRSSLRQSGEICGLVAFRRIELVDQAQSAADYLCDVQDE